MRKFLLTLIIIFLASPAFSHGTGYREININPPALEFFYSTGEKMSYREVKVFSPSDSKFAYQSGRTDENGRFAFVPNVSGDWRVIVRDEEGHQCEAVITINQDLSAQIIKNDSSLEGFNLFFRALLGVSVIFNLAMLIKIFRSKSNAHQ